MPCAGVMGVAEAEAAGRLPEPRRGEQESMGFTYHQVHLILRFGPEAARAGAVDHYTEQTLATQARGLRSAQGGM